MTRRPRLVAGNDKFCDMFSIRHEPGWAGVLTRGEAPGAMKNGTTIVKIVGDRGDWKPIGTKGTVLGSIKHSSAGIGYFIEWRDNPKVAVFITEKKIARE